MTLDILNIQPFISSLLKYLAVILCACIYLPKKDQTLRIAQLLVLVSDFILLFTNYFNIGVFVFILIQVCYRYYLQPNKIFVGVSITIALLLLIFYPNGLFFLYGFLSGYNLITAIHQNKRTMAFGVGLLLLCDINIVLRSFSVMLPYTVWMIWFFYLPSQIFITHEALRPKK